MNAFSRPAISRLLLRFPTGLILISAILGAFDPEAQGDYRDLLFWVLTVPLAYFFLRSFVLGLKYKKERFIYRGLFRTRAILVEEIDFFQIVDSSDDWPSLFLGILGEFTSVPGVQLKTGERISLRTCASSMPRVDRKIAVINRALNPQWSPPNEDNDEAVSDWAAFKMLIRIFRNGD